MEKLTKHQFALTSKHDLWKRIKSLEKQVESLQLTIFCNESTFNELNLELNDAHATIDLLMQEVQTLKRHNHFLLSHLSGTSPKKIYFK